VPVVIREDPLWSVQANRFALYALDLGWQDVTALNGDRRMWGLTDQLYRAIGSIGANIAEGYSQGTGKDRSLFSTNALGSARESRDWYYKARHLLDEQRFSHHLDLLSRIIRLLLVMASQQRGRTVQEEDEAYDL
jgi:four helix bundle protein